MAVRIQPSILSADFVNFEAEFESIANADGIHIDVMDGHFVPNLTFGLPMVKRMQEISKLPLDVHLMIDNPDLMAKDYAAAGVFSVTVHLEACLDPIKIAQEIKAKGSRAGLSIKPSTPVSALEEFLDHFDQILIMSVEPGFGGQAFLSSSLDRISQIKQIIGNRATWLQVDGGVGESNIAELARLGADTFVAGSAVFKVTDRLSQISKLRELALEGQASQL